jgi:hypothetical protein
LHWGSIWQELRDHIRDIQWMPSFLNIRYQKSSRTKTWCTGRKKDPTVRKIMKDAQLLLASAVRSAIQNVVLSLLLSLLSHSKHNIIMIGHRRHLIQSQIIIQYCRYP